MLCVIRHFCFSFCFFFYHSCCSPQKNKKQIWRRPMTSLTCFWSFFCFVCRNDGSRVCDITTMITEYIYFCGCSCSMMNVQIQLLCLSVWFFFSSSERRSNFRMFAINRNIAPMAITRSSQPRSTKPRQWRLSPCCQWQLSTSRFIVM